MEFKNHDKYYDFVVTGGGFTGVCCAIMAAREGLHTALITNRGFIGGNSGAEVRCPVDGADGEQQFNFSSRETGLIEEIRLNNLYLNKDGNPYRWDMVLMDFIAAEKNLDLYLNTCIDTVNGTTQITSVSGIQTTTEKRFTFHAPLFADNTGDGTIAALAGCSYEEGAESRETYGEKIAGPEKTDDVLLGTLTYTAKDTGHPVKFFAPDNAFDMEKSGCLTAREIPAQMFERFVWFYETGFGKNQVSEYEDVAEEHRELLYSIWDHIKKHPEEYHADNYDFEFISPFVGKRESRRIEGLTRLTEKDVCGQTEFPDACGYGGWAIDLHSPKGFFGTDPENWWVYLRGLYQIPLSAAIAKDCENLFVIGRCFSVSHVALGSTRLNATLATVGQAVGIAAAICHENGISAHGFGEKEIEELHKRQWKADQTVLGYRNADEKDLALSASVTASGKKRFVMEKPLLFFPADTVYGQSMPVKEGLKKISFLYQNNGPEAAPLKVSVYRAEKPQNYGPEILLQTFDLFLPPAKEDAWFDLDLSGLSFTDEFIFLRFDGNGNKNLLLGSAADRLPGIAALMQKENPIPNMVDYDTLTKLPFEWMKLGVPLELRKYSTAAQPNLNYAFCFRMDPEFSFYGPENVHNGYLRQYKSPNVWTAEGAEGEWICLSFPEAKELSELQITFDSNLNFRIRNLKPYDFNVIRELVKDYEIWIEEEDSSWKLLKTVTGNFQRVNKIPLSGIRAKSVKIRILATNGCESAGIFNISIY